MSDRSALSEVEITPEMIEAGREASDALPDGNNDIGYVIPTDELLKAVFKAMMTKMREEFPTVTR